MVRPDAPRRGFRLRYLVAGLLLLALIVALVGCAGFMRDRLYEPGEGLAAVPQWIGAPPREIIVTSGDGLRLAGYYWPPAAGEEDIVLVLHGRRDGYRRMAGYVERLTTSGRGVLVGSYRGFNENRGAPSQTGLIADARAFYRYARVQAGARGGVYVFGHSLGGAVAIQLAAREDLDGLVTLGTFTDIDAAAPVYGEWLIPDKWRSDEALADVEEPVLFIHGAIDDYITPDQSEALYAAACAPASIILLDGLMHRPNFRIIGPLITGWIDALEAGDVAGWRPEGTTRRESKPACGA
ncbi:MAG: alpha/beta hydrolase [Parasphingopyxis sp.]|nr:alpha/beta hydrolase [Sphingomonadales bacterium]